MTNDARTTDPSTAYAEAPSIIAEIGWVADQSVSRSFGSEMGREFWLRKAALLDRIALRETATYAPDLSAPAVQTAEQAALRLIEYDETHSGLSRRALDLVTGSDYREYVRDQYREWSCIQGA